MIASRFFRRHFLIAAAVIFTVVVLGMLSSMLVETMSRPELVERRSPPTLFARIVMKLGNGDPRKGVKEFLELSDAPGTVRGANIRVTLIDADGRAIYPPNSPPLPPDLDLSELDEDYETIPARPALLMPPKPPGVLDRLRMLFGPAPVGRGGTVLVGPGPGGAVFVGSGPGGPGPGGPGPIGPPAFLTRLPGKELLYLLVQFERPPPLPMPPPGGFFISPLLALFVSVLLGTGLAMLLFFRSLRDKAALADQVISELQKGNLKARFPIKKPDEVGQAMMRFNRMADEIERLVEHLRSVEQSRISLLQELAHDLRTPIASLKNLVETLQSKRKALDEKTTEELFALSVSEIEYFERLVEDLLLLARVSEPRYKVSTDALLVHDVLQDETDARAVVHSNRGIALHDDIAESAGEVAGDAHLLRRLFRNALDNAYSFAKKEVRVSARPNALGHYEIVIEDDGPGFPPELLAHFGDRRVSRMVQPKKDGRVSVGLGSVIMKTVTQIHGGTLRAENRPSGGARVTITLPLARAGAA